MLRKKITLGKKLFLEKRFDFFFPMESMVFDSKWISVCVKSFVVPTSAGELLASSTVRKQSKRRQFGVNPEVLLQLQGQDALRRKPLVPPSLVTVPISAPLAVSSFTAHWSWNMDYLHSRAFIHLFWSSAFWHPVSLAFCSTDLRSSPDECISFYSS